MQAICTFLISQMKLLVRLDVRKKNWTLKTHINHICAY